MTIRRGLVSVSAFLILALGIITARGGAQSVVRVPDAYPTIGAALAQAGAGTTILVGPGIYNENLTWTATSSRPT